MTTEDAFPIGCRVVRIRFDGGRVIMRDRHRIRGTVIGHGKRGKVTGWLVVRWDGVKTARHYVPPDHCRRAEESAG